MYDESDSKSQKYLQELATNDQQITSLRAPVSEKDTLLQRNKILSNLVEELKSDLETMQHEINTINSSTKHFIES